MLSFNFRPEEFGCDPSSKSTVNNGPGDSRTYVGFHTYDRVLHFYSIPELTLNVDNQQSVVSF